MNIRMSLVGIRARYREPLDFYTFVGFGEDPAERLGRDVSA